MAKYFGGTNYWQFDIYEETKERSGKALIGRIRIKPGSVLWKTAKHEYFRNVSLEDFIRWIESTDKARDTIS
jgi:hypothetical protein